MTDIRVVGEGPFEDAQDKHCKWEPCTLAE